MKRILRLASLACWLSTFDVRACEPRVEPLDFPTGGSASDARAARSEITKETVTPAVGTEVRRDTVLTIDLEYRIADFAPSRFKLMTWFKSGHLGRRSIDVDGKDPSLTLEHGAGRARVCVPLAAVYGDKATSVTWPLEVAITILQTDERGIGTSVATSKLFKLNTADMPAVALERQRKAPPIEYVEALDFVFNHFLGRSATYKSCLQRFPASQPKLTAAFRAWEARHRKDIDFVSELKFEALKEQFDGRSDAAMYVFDHLGDSYRQGYSNWSLEQMRDSCDRLVELGDAGEDDTVFVVGDYLKVLRTWRAKQ